MIITGLSRVPLDSLLMDTPLVGSPLPAQNALVLNIVHTPNVGFYVDTCICVTIVALIMEMATSASTFTVCIPCNK